MKISTFNENSGGSFRYSRIHTTENTTDAHGFLGIANHQVVGGKFAVHFIQGFERRSFGGGANPNRITFDLVTVESVQRLPGFMKQVVGNVHHVVDGTNTNQAQTVLQPLG